MHSVIDNTNEQTSSSRTNIDESSSVNEAISLPDWGIHLQPSGGILIDRKTLIYLRMSGIALELALQLARTQSFSSTALVRSILENRDLAIVTEELQNSLNAHSITEGWLHGELGSSIRVTGSTDSYLPISASLQLTNACNLSCSFCYANSGSPLNNELNTDDWLKVIERLSVAGLASVTLTGGEPTVVKGFTEILTAASALVEVVHIFTNGVKWRKPMIDLVSALGNVQCQISLDGLAPHHDSLRGKEGSFDSAISTIQLLSEAGVQVAVAMTVSPINFSDIEEVVKAVAEAGALSMRVGKAIPLGRGLVDDLRLGPNQTEHIIQQFENIRKQDNHGMELVGWDQCANGLRDELNSPDLGFEFMTPGYLNWHVRSDGIVTPCQIENKGFGHILKDALDDIGHPSRLADIQQSVQNCRCIQNITFDNESHDDLPFGFSSNYC